MTAFINFKPLQNAYLINSHGLQNRRLHHTSTFKDEEEKKSH